MQFDEKGVPMTVVPFGQFFMPTGAVLDSGDWTRFVFQHTVGTDSDGYADDAGGGVVGYIIPAIWWKSNTGAPLVGRYLMGLMLNQIEAVGAGVQPISPDIFLVLGVGKLATPQAHLGPPS
jgi:hypothetical protein